MDDTGRGSLITRCRAIGPLAPGRQRIGPCRLHPGI